MREPSWLHDTESTRSVWPPIEGEGLGRRSARPTPTPSCRRRRRRCASRQWLHDTESTCQLWPLRGEALGAGARVPHPCRPSSPAVAMREPSRAPRHRVHPIGVALEGEGPRAPERASHTRAVPVIAGGGDARAVRAPGHRMYTIFVALEGENLVADGGIPHPRRLVRTGGGDGASPSGLQAPSPRSVWPLRVRASAPERASHTRAVSSRPAVAMREPSGLHDTENTGTVVAFKSENLGAGGGVPTPAPSCPHLRWRCASR